MKVSMRILALAAAALVAGCATTPEPPPPPPPPPAPEVYELTDPDAGFSVTFPGQPVRNAQTQETQIGEVTTVSYSQNPTEAESFSVTVVDLPPAAVKGNAMDLLKAVAAGAVKSLEPEITEQRELSTEGYPGYEIHGKTETRDIVGRFYLVGPRLFQQLLLYPLGERDESADLFLKSFKIDPEVAAQLVSPPATEPDSETGTGTETGIETETETETGTETGTDQAEQPAPAPHH